MTPYAVDYERDRTSGSWTAVIDRSQGASCVVQAATLNEARVEIRKALALYLGRPAAVPVERYAY